MGRPMRTDVLLSAAIERLAAAGVDTPRLDAEILLARASGVSRTSLFTWPEKEITEEACAQFESWLERRIRHEPVAYLLGDQEFYGRLFGVSPAVLIPRPETEHIIEVVLGLSSIPHRIVDVGTGSGCIAVTLALELEGVELCAVDISDEALGVARENIGRHGVEARVTCCQSDLLSAGGLDGPFDLVVSNPPYVESTYLADMQPDVADYEPHQALFAGESGLDVIERLAAQAYERLSPGGALVMEFGAGQHDQVVDLLVSQGYTEVTLTRDLSGHPRVVCGLKARF